MFMSLVPPPSSILRASSLCLSLTKKKKKDSIGQSSSLSFLQYMLLFPNPHPPTCLSLTFLFPKHFQLNSVHKILDLIKTWNNHLFWSTIKGWNDKKSSLRQSFFYPRLWSSSCFKLKIVSSLDIIISMEF